MPLGGTTGFLAIEIAVPVAAVAVGRSTWASAGNDKAIHRTAAQCRSCRSRKHQVKSHAYPQHYDNLLPCYPLYAPAGFKGSVREVRAQGNLQITCPTMVWLVILRRRDPSLYFWIRFSMNEILATSTSRGLRVCGSHVWYVRYRTCDGSSAKPGTA